MIVISKFPILIAWLRLIAMATSLVLSNIGLIAQSPSELKDLKALQHFKNPMQGLPDSICRLPNLISDDCVMIEDEDSLDFYCIETDIDSLRYLIYSSACSPYAETIVLFQSGGSYTKVYSSPGELIDYTLDGFHLRCYMQKEACCCDYYNSMVIAELLKTQVLSTRRFEYHLQTVIPSVNLVPIRVRGKLRTDPRIDNKDHADECREGEIIQGNIWHNLSSDVLAFALYKKGRWTLVAVKLSDEIWNIGWVR